MCGKNWTEIQKLVKTRDNNQIRSHAQKVFKRLRKYVKHTNNHEQSISNDKRTPGDDKYNEWIEIIKDKRFAAEIHPSKDESKPDKDTLQQKLNEEDEVS
jgi:hypothetical protein